MKHIHFVLFILQIFIFTSVINAIEWEYCDTDSVNITSMFSFGNGHLVAGSNTESNVVLESKNYGKTWDTLNSTDFSPDEIRWLKYYNNKLYAGAISACPLYTSTDSGKTWSRVDSCHGDMGYCMVAKDSLIISGGWHIIRRSEDYGKTWEYIDLLYTVDPDIGAVYCITSYKDTFYIGTAHGVYASKDLGLTWEKRGKNDESAKSAIVTSITFMDTILIIGTYGGIYFSHNFGGNGDDINWKWTFHNGLWLTEAFIISDSLIYVINSYSESCDLFMSSDTGKEWKQLYIDSTIPLINVYGFFDDEKYIYAYYTGIWRLPKDTNNVAQKQKPVQTFSEFKITLKNRLVEINSLQKGEIELELYSVNGRCVQLIYNGIIKKGSNIFPIASNNKIARGVYILSAKINNNRISQKVYITY